MSGQWQDGRSPGRPVRFVPVNREDLLLLSSGLVLPRQVVPGEIWFPTVEGGRAVLEDGLRSSEVELLQAGKTERFPVLVRLVPGDGFPENRTLSLDDVEGLCFRTDDERDQFLFRPVAEWSAEGLRCWTEPKLFDLAGPPRFSLSPRGESSPAAVVADRITGGVAMLLELVALCPDCVAEVGTLLGVVQGPLAGLVRQAHQWILRSHPPSADVRQAAVVVREFGTSAAGTSRTLVDAVAEGLAAEPTDDCTREQEMVWARFCREIQDNLRVLQGRMLSDQGNVILRAAVLAARTDDARGLAFFRAADRPSGRLVTAVAAFLQGLRLGLGRLPWECKRSHQRFLSQFRACLEDLGPEGLDSVVGLRVRSETVEGLRCIRLEWRGGELARGTPSRECEGAEPGEDRTWALPECAPPEQACEEIHHGLPPPPPPPCLGDEEWASSGPAASADPDNELLGVEDIRACLEALGCTFRDQAPGLGPTILPNGRGLLLDWWPAGEQAVLEFCVQVSKKAKASEMRRLLTENGSDRALWRYALGDSGLVLRASLFFPPTKQQLMLLEGQLAEKLAVGSTPPHHGREGGRVRENTNQEQRA